MIFVNVAVPKKRLRTSAGSQCSPALRATLTALGARIHVQAGAGNGIPLDDAAYVGANIIASRDALVREADIVLAVQPPAGSTR